MNRYAEMWGDRVVWYLDLMHDSDRRGLHFYADWCEGMAYQCARRAGATARLITRL